jgi:hypothetical protein
MIEYTLSAEIRIEASRKVEAASQIVTRSHGTAAVFDGRNRDQTNSGDSADFDFVCSFFSLR